MIKFTGILSNIINRRSMKKNKIIPYLLISVIILTSCSFNSRVYYGEHKLPGHPRLLMLKGEETGLTKFIESDTLWLKIHKTILNESDSILDKPVLERIQTGRRLLSVSREILRRVYFLSYSYRFTADPKYLKRAEKEMLAAAGLYRLESVTFSGCSGNDCRTCHRI